MEEPETFHDEVSFITPSNMIVKCGVLFLSQSIIINCYLTFIRESAKNSPLYRFDLSTCAKITLHLSLPPDIAEGYGKIRENKLLKKDRCTDGRGARASKQIFPRNEKPIIRKLCCLFKMLLPRVLELFSFQFCIQKLDFLIII